MYEKLTELLAVMGTLTTVVVTTVVITTFIVVTW